MSAEPFTKRGCVVLSSDEEQGGSTNGGTKGSEDGKALCVLAATRFVSSPSELSASPVCPSESVTVCAFRNGRVAGSASLPQTLTTITQPLYPKTGAENGARSPRHVDNGDHWKPEGCTA